MKFYILDPQVKKTKQKGQGEIKITPGKAKVEKPNDKEKTGENQEEEEEEVEEEGDEEDLYDENSEEEGKIKITGSRR